MTKDQIHDALRMLGRGFINHAQVERLAGELAVLLAPAEEFVDPGVGAAVQSLQDSGGVLPKPKRYTERKKAD